MEHFMNRRSPYLSPKLFQYTKLQKMVDRKSILTCTSTASFSVSNGCWLTVSFIAGTLFFSAMGLVGPFTCTLMVNVMRVFCATRSFQHFNSVHRLYRIIFMQDGTPPHIAKPVMQVLKRHFGNERIINCHFQKSIIQDHQIAIPVTSSYGVILKMLCSVALLHF